MKISHNNQDRIFLTTVLMAVAALVFLGHKYGLLDSIEWKAVDQYFGLRYDLADEEYQLSGEIVPIGIDDQSVDPQFSPATDTWGKGGWFTRDHYTTQMQMYQDFFKPSVVAYDILLPQMGEEYESGNHPADLSNLFSEQGQISDRKKIRNIQRDGNNRLSGSVSTLDMTANIRTLFAITFPEREKREGERISDDEIEILDEMSLPEETILGSSEKSAATILEMPFDALMDSPAFFAPINLPRERDNTIRRLPLLIPYQNDTGKIRHLPSFTFMSFLLYLGISPDELMPKGEELPWIEVIPGEHIELQTEKEYYHIPIDAELKMHLNPRFTYKDMIDSGDLFPYVEVTHLGLGLSNAQSGSRGGKDLVDSIRKRKPKMVPEYFNDKLLLVYPAATQTLDMGNFSLSWLKPDGSKPKAPNGFAYILGLENLIKKDHIMRVSASQIYVINLVFLLLIGMPQMLLRAKRIHLWIVFGMLIYAIFVAVTCYYEQRIYPMATPLIVGFILGTAEVSIRLVREQHAKARINSMFGTYLSPELVTSMLESGEEPQLGGVDMEITAFFSDVQGFSGFSEKLTPHQLVDLMNEYLTAMTEILMDQGCYVDKYIGDAIVGIFNVPIELEHHALKACVASMHQHRRLEELRQKWKSEGDKWPPIVSVMQARLGLNTGHATVGNMGSSNRFNYTMMGDTVNLAARCESGAKAYGVYSMVTGETKEAATSAGDDCVFRFLDKIIVKGRTLPAEMYEIVCLKEDLNSEIEHCLEVYNAAMGTYLKQDWTKAYEMFTKSSNLEPNRPELNDQAPTTPSAVMMQRALDMKESPPGKDWDGVYVMTSK